MLLDTWFVRDVHFNELGPLSGPTTELHTEDGVHATSIPSRGEVGDGGGDLPEHLLPDHVADPLGSSGH